MKSKDIKATTASQIRTSMGLTLIDSICLFGPLLVSLAVLGWATWQIRLVNPMAFAMFAGLMAAAFVLAIVDVWPRRTHSSSAPSLKPASEPVCLSTPISEQIELSQSIQNAGFINI